MSDLTQQAYDLASKAAREIVRGDALEMMRKVLDGEVDGEEDFEERLHEEVDNSLIYTADQWVCAWGLPDSSTTPEELGATTDTFVQTQAFLNLEEAVRDWFGRIDADDAAGLLIQSARSYADPEEVQEKVAALEESFPDLFSAFTDALGRGDVQAALGVAEDSARERGQLPAMKKKMRRRRR